MHLLEVYSPRKRVSRSVSVQRPNRLECVKSLNDTVAITPAACIFSTDMERLRTLKKDVIDQAFVTSSKLIDNLNLIIQSEQNKFAVKNRYMESTSE